MATAAPAKQPITLTVRFQTFTHALMFWLGMAFVIVVGFGGAATLLGSALFDYKDLITRIGGVVVIIFGLHTLGVFKIPFLNYDTRKQYSGGVNYGSSVLMGVFFAAGWSPCIGPTFGAIITLGLEPDSSGHSDDPGGGICGRVWACRLWCWACWSIGRQACCAA